MKFSGTEKAYNAICHVFALPRTTCLFRSRYCQGSFPLKDTLLFKKLEPTPEEQMGIYYKCRKCLEKNLELEIIDEQED